MTIIDTKLTHNLYPSIDTLFDDINLLCDNAYSYYSRESAKSRVRWCVCVMFFISGDSVFATCLGYGGLGCSEGYCNVS